MTRILALIVSPRSPCERVNLLEHVHPARLAVLAEASGAGFQWERRAECARETVVIALGTTMRNWPVYNFLLVWPRLSCMLRLPQWFIHLIMGSSSQVSGHQVQIDKATWCQSGNHQTVQQVLAWSISQSEQPFNNIAKQSVTSVKQSQSTTNTDHPKTSSCSE